MTETTMPEIAESEDRTKEDRAKAKDRRRSDFGQ